MICDEVMELMQRDLDGDLNENEQEAMVAHLRRCSACAEMYERLQHLSNELHNLPKVIPPHSLVDAILPKLEQLDQLAGDEPDRANAAGATALRPSGNRTRRWIARFPFKTVSGVVAAGIVIGMFIAGIGQRPSSEQADELLLNEAAKDGAESSSSAAEDAPASGSNREVDKQAPLDHEIAGTTAADTTADTSADNDASAQTFDQKPGGKQDTPAAAANTKREKTADAAAANESGNGKKQAADASANENTIKKDPASNVSTGDSPERRQPEDEPAAGNRIDEQVGQEDGKRKAEEPLYGITIMPEQPAPDAGKAGNREHHTAFFAPIEPDRQQLTSPDGLYNAAVENRQVVITNAKTGERVFVSEHQWEESDRVQLFRWMDNLTLTYRVVSGETEQQFTIDVDKKTETKN